MLLPYIARFLSILIFVDERVKIFFMAFFLPALQKMFCMYQLLSKVQKYYFCSATAITVKLIFYRPQKFYQSLTINENIFDILVLHVIMLPPEKKKK